MNRGAVVLDDLVKRYGDIVALDGLSFDVPAGSIVGLLGPNGSGKTTTISILSTAARLSWTSPSTDAKRPGKTRRPAGPRPVRSREPQPGRRTGR